MSDDGALLAAGAALIVVTMAVVWAIAVRIANAGIVDVAWSGNFSLLALLYAVLGSGWLPRRLLMAAMVVLWSLRLGSHLYRRVMGDHPVEDGRYQQLRKDWAPRANARFFCFFELQGALNVILSLPALVACRNPKPAFHASRSRGDEYREYQRTTSAFVPWFRKAAPARMDP